MNGKNFLLGFLGGAGEQSVKGKNPNPSAKIIKTKGNIKGLK